LIAKERGAVFLSSSLDHHSVVLRKGPEAKCVRIGFQLAPEDYLEAFDRQTGAIGIEVARKSDPEPAISDAVIFEDTKGSLMEVFKRRAGGREDYGTSLVLIRPDQFVAWTETSEGVDPEPVLQRAVGAAGPRS
jgi:hypothetical protein